MSQQKIGLIPLIAIVIGSQLGSGVFMLPQMLAPYGFFAIIGWIVSGLGALSLAMVFVGLVKRLPKTGGPHVYVHNAFGPSAAYFTGWAYWLSCTLGSATVVGATVTYLTPIIGIQSPIVFAMYEIALLITIGWINLRGIASAGALESVLGVVKLITLFVVPAVGLLSFNSANIQIAEPLMNSTSIFLIGKACTLTLWAFLGVEAATTPAESVENPTVTIPTALIVGTCCVIFLYLLNSFSLMGLIPHEQLRNTHTPYVLATKYIFGGNWHLVIAVFSAIVCLSNLNAWILASGQIACGIANDHLLPPIFKKQNENGAPFWAILLSCGVIVPVILFTIDDNISNQIFAIIDLSVQAALMIYLICTASYIVILRREKKSWWHYECITCIVAAIFCLAMLAASDLTTLMLSSLFFISGLPVYFYWILPNKAHSM